MFSAEIFFLFFFNNLQFLLQPFFCVANRDCIQTQKTNIEKKLIELKNSTTISNQIVKIKLNNVRNFAFTVNFHECIARNFDFLQSVVLKYKWKDEQVQKTENFLIPRGSECELRI